MLDVGRFGIDPSGGFLTLPDPQILFGEDVDPYFKELERVGQQISELLESHKMRDTLDRLPVHDLMIVRAFPRRRWWWLRESTLSWPAPMCIR